MTAKDLIKLVVFQGKQIRKIIHEGEWWFAVIDVVEVLTASPTPRQYWGKTKKREFTDLQLSPVWVQLKLEASDALLAADHPHLPDQQYRFPLLPSRPGTVLGTGAATEYDHHPVNHQQHLLRHLPGQFLPLTIAAH